MRRLLALVSAAVVMSAVGVGVAPAAEATGTYTITVKISPSTPHVDDQMTVSGVVTDGAGAPQPGIALTVQRADRNGTADMFPAAMPTGTDGSYSADDPDPAVRGTMTYTVTATIDGSTGQASVFVRRLPTRLTIGASRSIVASGHQVRITAHLGSPSTNRTVSLYARPYRRDRYKLASHAVSTTTGNISATPTVRRRTLYTAQFAGDNTYAPAAARIVVRARAVISERLTGGYATEGAFRIYHAGAHPVLVAHLHPQLDGVCLWFRAQRRFNGAWHTVATRCFNTDADGYARGEFTGAHLGSPYRVRARWRGSRAALSRNGAWLKLKFR